MFQKWRNIENDCNRDVVERILKAGADLNARTEWGDTPAHYAAQYSCYEVLRQLIEKGAEVDKPAKCKFINYFSVYWPNFGIMISETKAFRNHTLLVLYCRFEIVQWSFRETLYPRRGSGDVAVYTSTKGSKEYLYRQKYVSFGKGYGC